MAQRQQPSPTPLAGPILRAEIRNFLSLRKVEVNLGPLNVLVGPNGGGKSNFLTVFRFLGEVARTDLTPAVNSLFGGYPELRFRGNARPADGISIRLTGRISEHSSVRAPDEYELRFQPVGGSAEPHVLRRTEKLILKRTKGRGRRITLTGGRYEFGDEQPRGPARSERAVVAPDASALSVLRRIGAATDTRQVADLADVFESLRLFDPQVSLARQPAVEDTGPLRADAGNLAAVLARWQHNAPDLVAAIADDLRDILPGFQDFVFTRLNGSGAVRVDLNEHGLSGTTPLIRASYGTVRAIALLAMLRDPNPPRLTCLEEIDHGLHPHALDVVVERLREAAERSQIILATHSPALVNRLQPEEIIVFERDAKDSSTRVIQRDPEVLRRMSAASGLGLGELWFSGTLGGVPR